MRSPETILLDTDWAGLGHAYGSAADAPEQLLNLLSENAEACGNALAYLDAAVLHQYTVYSSTAPAVRFVAAILDDPRVLVPCESAFPWDDRERPLRAALLGWLGTVAESAAWDDPEGYEDDEEAEAFAACRALIPELYARVSPYLSDPDSAVRQAATVAVMHMLEAPELVGQRPGVASQLLLSAPDASPVDRAGIALTLGRWGIAALLDDEHPGVRACAAIFTAYDNDPAALDEVRSALRDPVAADDLLDEQPPQLETRLRFLVEALLRRTTTFDEVADIAVVIAGVTSENAVRDEWGPLLERAFPEGLTGEMSEAQHRYLAALVANDRCWGNNGDRSTLFEKIGLPTGREEVRALLTPPGSAPAPR